MVGGARGLGSGWGEERGRRGGKRETEIERERDRDTETERQTDEQQTRSTHILLNKKANKEKNCCAWGQTIKINIYYKRKKERKKRT